MTVPKQGLHVGLCGAGIGGLAAAIAIAKGGAKVTVLEAAPELGEIGAGIQMTPNVARLLQRWGADAAIGEDLTRFEALHLRTRDGTEVGYAAMERIERELGYPWWLVHRHHLHTGLVEIARKNGCTILVNSRVSNIDYQQRNSRVKVTTESGTKHTFDLLIGSDGVSSIVRRTLFPNVTPSPPTTNAAYRAIVPMSQVAADPIAKSLVTRPNGSRYLAMEVWMAPNAYIISYPISAGRDFNMVLSHHRPYLVTGLEKDVSMADFRATYADFDPRIKRVLEMVPQVQRWPLLVTTIPDSWSSPEHNVVLMGDAAHSMVNHMAQGAATSMEDGAYLGICLRHVVSGELSLAEAISLYEKERMPKARMKQQVSFLNGAIWHLPDGPAQRRRDEAMRVELKGGPFLRSPNLYADPWTVLEVYGYDSEAHAEGAVGALLRRKRARQGEGEEGRFELEVEAVERYVNWFLEEGDKLRELPRVGGKAKL